MEPKETPQAPAAVVPEKKVETFVDASAKASGEAPLPKVETPSVVEATVDEFGYPIVKEEPKAPEAKKPEVVAKPKVDETTLKTNTGYEEEPKVEAEAPKEPEIKKDLELGFELKVSEIIPKEDVAAIKLFVKAHSLNEKQAQAFVDLKTIEFENFTKAETEFKKAQERGKLLQRKTWWDELKNDKIFGGEKFESNMKRAGRVLEEHFPATKKELTARGTMLPPYVMRDFAALADQLYATETAVLGDPPAPPETKTEVDPALAYYQ